MNASANTCRLRCVYQQALAGNPLAVVFDRDGLDDAAMQAIAARVQPVGDGVHLAAANNPTHRASVRIFTPRLRNAVRRPSDGRRGDRARRSGRRRRRPAIFVLEEKIGPVRCAVSQRARTACSPNSTCRSCRSRWRFSADPAAVGGGARPRRRTRSASRTTSCRPWSGGVPYVTDAGRRARRGGQSRARQPRLDGAGAAAGAKAPSPAAYVYCRETVGARQRLPCAHVRAGHLGIPEDPATGSAAAAFAGAIMHFDSAGRRRQRAIWIEQGVEMGRPSLIRLELDVEAGQRWPARASAATRSR